MVAFFMRILFTTNQGNLAGSTYSVFYLAKGLAEKGHQIHIASKKNVLLYDLVKDSTNISCHEVPFGTYWDWRSGYLLKEVVVKNKIQIVNAQGGKDRTLTILSKWFFRLNVKLVFTRRQRPRNEPWVKRWFHTKGTSAIVMISDGLKKIFVNKGYQDSQLIVIKNGVPNNLVEEISNARVEELRSHYRLQGQKVVGCLSRKKSQEQLLNALQFLSVDYVILFVGILEEDIEWSLVKHRPKQRLIFTGKIEHELALHHLAMVDVNVLPSYLDGFGLALVESMHCGIPVVGSDFGGIPDIIQDGENGFLFQNGDVNELAMKIETLLDDEMMRNRLVIQALADAKRKFSMDRVVNEYEALFYSLSASE